MCTVSATSVITPHMQREQGKVISLGVHMYMFICIYVCGQIFFVELYFSDRLTFSNFHSRTSHQIIHRLALPLLSPETLSSLNKLRIFSYLMHTLLYLSEG